MGGLLDSHGATMDHLGLDDLFLPPSLHGFFELRMMNRIHTLPKIIGKMVEAPWNGGPLRNNPIYTVNNYIECTLPKTDFSGTQSHDIAR